MSPKITVVPSSAGQPMPIAPPIEPLELAQLSFGSACAAATVPDRFIARGRAVIELCRRRSFTAEAGTIITAELLGALNRADREGARRFLEPVHRYLDSTGLPSQSLLRLGRFSLVGTWIDTAAVERFGEIIAEHLQTIARIERMRPGSAALLHRSCGLHCFGRYEAEALVGQYDALLHARAGRRYPFGCVPIFYPLEDEPGSFHLNRDPVASMLREARALEVPVLFFESASQLRLLKQLYRAARLFGPIQSACIGGHGAPGGFLTLGPEQDLEAAWLTDPAVRSALSRIFRPGASIVVRSCWGAASHGLARRIAAEFGGQGVEVYGTEEETWLESLKLRRRATPAGEMLALSARFGPDGSKTEHFTGPVDVSAPSTMPDPRQLFRVATLSHQAEP